MNRIVSLIFIIMALPCNALLAKDVVRVDPTEPLSRQLTEPNTKYEIREECKISEKTTKEEVTCDRLVDIIRADVSFECDERVNIDGKTYYITSDLIRVYWNESLILPDGFLVIDSQKQQILSREGTYRPKNGNSIYIGCERKTKRHYKHCKVYYACNQPVYLTTAEGLLTNDDCVVLDKRLKQIETYHPCFVPEHQGSYYIAKRERGNVEYSILEVINLPENITLSIKKGIVSNGILNCNGLTIIESNKQIFNNVILTGTLTNGALKVEWFGCSTKKNGYDNYEVVSKYVLPSALLTHSNIYHSRKGTYDFAGGYPIKNYHWGYDHNYMMDCEGIEVYGTGPKTIIRGVPTGGDNPADVFCFVDLKNITVHDLSVTAVEGSGSNKTHGTNAFSLCQSFENITIQRTVAYDLPVVHMPTYPDGAKSYTMQIEAGSYQKDVLIKDNVAKNVAYGFDYSRTSRAGNDYRKNICFVGNRIENAIVGGVIHEEVSPNRDEQEYIIVDGNEFINCQVGMYCMLTKALAITNNRFIKTKQVPLTKYYKDYYGLYITGAFNTKVENNYFKLNDCSSFIYVTEYSFYPVWHGEVSSLTIDGATIRGKNRNTAVDIGSNAKNDDQKKFFKDISINNIKK